MAIDIYYFNSGRAITASGGFFDEPIGSACGMPQGGYCKPPARLVVITTVLSRNFFFTSGNKYDIIIKKKQTAKEGLWQTDAFR